MTVVKKLDPHGNVEGYWDDALGTWVTEEDYENSLDVGLDEEEGEEEE